MERGYFDIHTHILPGVDDGAGNMDETLEMLNMEYDTGVRNIILTPHYVLHNIKEKNIRYSARVKEQFEKTTAMCKREIPDLKLYLGNELFYCHGILEELSEHRANTLAGSRYILTEFHTDISYKDLKNAVSDYFMAGYKPVLAHIERYSCLYHDFENMADIKKAGCMFQMNTENFLEGRFSKNRKFCVNAVKNGYVDFISTDAHSCVIRRPVMEEAVKYLQKKVDSRILEQILYENPIKIINGGLK